MRSHALFALTLILFFSACAAPASSVAPEAPQASPAAPSQTPTAVIDWFPATATRTPFPTYEPSVTPQPFPGLGAQVFSDDFSIVSVWSHATASSQGGNNLILDRNRLTLAANITPVSLSSLRTGLILSNFYAEVTATVNRCAGTDAYGLLFRAGSEAFNYRFLVNCSGNARVDRVRDSIAIPLQDWLPSGDAPPGAPGQVRLGVWTSGVEMRFFLNGRYQFTVLDPVFKSGGLGVYANASSPDGMNVSFSDLVVRSVEYVSPTPTATASKTPLPSRTPRPTP